MIVRVTVRAFRQYQVYCSPGACSKRWLSDSVKDESRKFSVTIGGKTIRYIRSGEGEHAVLCLPRALGSSLTDFKLQINGLDQKAFTIVAWDPPGYGHSRPPNRDFSPGFLNRDADYAVDLMKELGLPKFSVLGWSDGGITGIFLAAKYPQNLRKMVIWDVNLFITQEEVMMLESHQIEKVWSGKTKKKMIELYGEDGFQTMRKQWVNELMRICTEKGGDICKTELTSIQCPLFVLHGKKSSMVVPEHPQYIIDNVPGSQLYTFDKGKDDIHLKYAKEFNSLVHKFLTSDQISATADRRFLEHLPPFWSENPAVWFAHIEAQLRLSNIKDDSTKFSCLLLLLDRKTAALVEDVICDPPGDGKYDLLKSELINRLKVAGLQQPPSNGKLGDRKPSELLKHLRKVAGSEVSDCLLHCLWLEGLPSYIQVVVKSHSASLDALARLADKVAKTGPVSTSTDLNECLVDAIADPSVLSRSHPEEPTETLFEGLLASAGTKGETHENDSLNDVILLKCDFMGLPLPGSTTAQDVLRKIQPISENRYHSLLTDFPDILYPAKLQRVVSRRGLHRIFMRWNLCVSEPDHTTPLTEDENRIAREIINSMIDQGTARPSTSCYGSPLALSRNEELGGSGWCIVPDYRLLNKNTVRSKYHMGFAVDVIHSLRGCKVFSVVNLRKRWTLIPIEDDDVRKTAVVTSFGKFEFPYMLYGLRNSRKTWQIALNSALQRLPFCYGFRDDVLVFSRDHDEHIHHITTVFERLSLNGIHVNASTSVFGESSVDFYAYSISSSGCSPATENISKAIRDMQPPERYRDLFKFVYMMEAYRSYIPDQPYQTLRDFSFDRKAAACAFVRWTPELEQAFIDCKRAMSCASHHEVSSDFVNRK